MATAIGRSIIPAARRAPERRHSYLDLWMVHWKRTYRRLTADLQAILSRVRRQAWNADAGIYLECERAVEIVAPRRPVRIEAWACTQRPCAPALPDESRGTRMLFLDR